MITRDDVGAERMGFEAVRALLRSPDRGNPLVLEGDALVDEAAGFSYPIREGVPLLFPEKLQGFLKDDRIQVPFELYEDASLQYMLFATIKQETGMHNCMDNDAWYQRHLAWSKELVRTVRGTVLDIGCDDPQLSAGLFPKEALYLGLDPLFGAEGGFRLAGLAEHIPLANESVDNVAFLTSLDHVFDYHRALDEAERVLKPGGGLYLGSLVWHHSAELYNDHVHFHHFREHEIFGALAHLRLESLARHAWKGKDQRDAIYCVFRKTA